MFDEHARAICTELLLPPMALLKLRDFIMAHPLRPLPGIIEMGHTVVEEERRWKELEELHTRLKKKGSKERRPKNEAANSLGSLKRATAEKKLEELRREYHAAAARLSSANTGDEGAPVQKDDASSQRKVASTLLRLSPVAGVRIGNSTSTKLDYILNEVCCHLRRSEVWLTLSLHRCFRILRARNSSSSRSQLRRSPSSQKRLISSGSSTSSSAESSSANRDKPSSRRSRPARAIACFSWS